MAPLPSDLLDQLGEVELADVLEYVFSMLVYPTRGEEKLEVVFDDGAYRRLFVHLHATGRRDIEARAQAVRRARELARFTDMEADHATRRVIAAGEEAHELVRNELRETDHDR